MNTLDDANLGSFGLIYWMEKTNYELSEREKEKLRQKSISDTLNATLMNHMYEPSKAITDMQTVMQRAFSEANSQQKMIENGTEMKSEVFLVGDPNTIKRIIEIETSANFRGWTNPYLIDEIKRTENA